MEGYTKWVLHGEASSHAAQTIKTNRDINESNYDIDMQGVVHDAFGLPNKEHEYGNNNSESVGDEPNEKANEFYELIRDAEKELYPSCKSFMKLSFVIQLFHIKCIDG